MSIHSEGSSDKYCCWLLFAMVIRNRGGAAGAAAAAASAVAVAVLLSVRFALVAVLPATVHGTYQKSQCWCQSVKFLDEVAPVQALGPEINDGPCPMLGV